MRATRPARNANNRNSTAAPWSSFAITTNAHTAPTASRTNNTMPTGTA